MQYLLTEKEYADLHLKQTYSIAASRDNLQALCTKIANEMPILWGWSDNETPKPWGCILSTEEEWYCDSCIVQEICPNINKAWSK